MTPQRTEMATADDAIAAKPSWCGDFLSLKTPIVTRETTQAPVRSISVSIFDPSSSSEGRAYR